LVHERSFISSREWAPLDRRHFRIEPESYRTEYSVANVGALRIGRIADSHAMQMAIRPPVIDGLLIVVYERGTARLVLPGTDEPAIGNAATGCIYGNEPGTWAATSDGTSRRYLWLPAKLLRQKLEVLLDGQNSNLWHSSRYSIRRAAPEPRSVACSISCSPNWNVPIRC